MKKWQTITATALLSASLAGIGTNFYHAMQPTHYQGETFVNEKKSSHSHSSSSTSTTQSTSDSSSSTASTDYDTSVNTAPSQPASVEQPIVVTGEPTKPLQMGGTIKPDEITGLTFSVYDCGIAESTIGEIEVGCVVCNELIQKTKVMPIEDCEPFADWMRGIAGDKTSLNNSMDSNYNYWVQYVKGQQ